MYKVARLLVVLSLMLNLSSLGTLLAVLLMWTLKPRLVWTGAVLALLGRLAYEKARRLDLYLGLRSEPSPTSHTSNSQDDSR